MSLRLAADRPFKPLVIGAPRTGHMLCQVVLSAFVPAFPAKADLRQGVFDCFVNHLAEHLARAVTSVAAQHGLEDGLMFNTNFRHFLGGPKWIRDSDHSRCVTRKYIGFRGKGDFTLLSSHPIECLDSVPITPSHETPDLWPTLAYFEGHTKFATIRNPVATLSSSCFSVNALTSEYIQRYIPPQEDNDLLRQKLALYKLTDMDFFDGLAVFLKNYCDRYMTVQDRYYAMRWEDLIDRPAETIQQLGRYANLEIDARIARSLWDSIKFKNLSGNHAHNFRRAGARAQGWKHWVTNHHLERIKEHGFEPFLEANGYGPIEMLDETKYTDFQKSVDDAIRKGEKPQLTEDLDLFGFAFNKSNLDSSKFAFKRYGWREETSLERSSFTDEQIPLDVWDAAEAATARINRVLEAVRDSRFYEPESALASIDRIHRAFKGSFGDPDDANFENGCTAAKALLEQFFRLKTVVIQGPPAAASR